jgi:hypothetical protein
MLGDHMPRKMLNKEDLNRLNAQMAFNPAEFCCVFGISLTLLYKLWEKGKGPPYAKVHKRRIITRRDGEAWLSEMVKETARSGRAAYEKGRGELGRARRISLQHP